MAGRKKRVTYNMPKSLIELDTYYTLKEIGDNHWIKGLGYYALYFKITRGQLSKEDYTEIQGKKNSYYKMLGSKIIELDKRQKL